MRPKAEHKDFSIKTFLNVMGDLDVHLAVTDFTTDEILFSSRKMNESYGIDYNPDGKRCWEVYQHEMKGRCNFCPLVKLEKNPDKPIVWESFNPDTGRWLRNTSSVIKWDDDKFAHLRQSVDITESKMMSDCLHQQELMNTLSQSFILNESAEVLLPNVLNMAGNFLSVDRALIISLHDDEYVLYEWCLENIFVKIRAANVIIDKEHVKELFSEERKNYITEKDLPPPRRLSGFSEKGLASFLLVPIFVNGVLWGSMNLEMWSEHREWSENEIALSKTISNMIGGVISREEIQKNVKEAEARLQTIFNMTPLACTFFDIEHNAVACNEEAASMYGLKSKQEYLNNFHNISPKFQPDGVLSSEKASEMLSRAFASGHEIFEWVHLHADGSEMPVEISLIKVKWRGSYRIACYARDLRELKMKDTQLEKTQKELRLERSRAEQSTHAKNNFLANMSHEMRTPMNAIIGMTKIAKNSDDVEHMQYCLGRIDDAASHLLGVINDILDVSKIESGKLELSYGDFLLENMLQRISSVINFTAEQKKQDFIIKIGEDVPAAIVSDQQRLEQVITSLLSNAVKFTMKKGKIGLNVKKLSENDGIYTLLFEVIDNGIGISKEQQKRLFKYFEQLDGSISRRFGGAGLGLAISKNIVELMGGSIGVESDLQEGAKFFFTIKAKKGASSEPSRLKHEVDWQNVRILVVDDDHEVSEYFENIADRYGIMCKTVSDGYEACRVIEQEKSFDMIFIDQLMPGMDGIKLTQKIRSQFDDNTIVIMTTTAEWEHVKKTALAAGADRFVSKPLLPSLLIDCINESLGHKEQHQKNLLASRRKDIFAGKRILLAEDIEINREILIELLNETKVEIICAENGRAAVEQFSGNPDSFDLILMDIHMPDMDGYEATKNIRSLNCERASHIPIIAMTANVFKEDVEKCLDSGMNDHLGKPVDSERMLVKLKKYLL